MQSVRGPALDPPRDRTATTAHRLHLARRRGELPLARGARASRRSAEVIAAAHRGEYGVGDRGPVVDDLAVAEPQHPEPSPRELCISPTVTLERALGVVERSAIDLDHERLSDEEVDSSDTGNGHLALQAGQLTPHPQSEERLCPRLADAVGGARADPMASGDQVATQVRSSMQRRVESGQVELMRRAASVGLERVDRTCDQARDRCRAIQPMNDGRWSKGPG